jgi:tRNA G18 (ribose-2'-O)-methylase SpoU
MRGYSVIGLDSVKFKINLGAAMRAAGVYGAAALFFTGRRTRAGNPDTTKQYRHTPMIRVPNLHDVVPFDCVPVAVDIIDGAIPLPEYKHPERAFYIFGAEDNTLGRRITSWCRDTIFVPTNGCMNLAATVNVVLYDRMCKARSHGHKSDNSLGASY